MAVEWSRLTCSLFRSYEMVGCWEYWKGLICRRQDTGEVTGKDKDVSPEGASIPEGEGGDEGHNILKAHG